MTPWSVRPSAGCSNAAARSASASILQAPSSTEYSEWTWRWTHLIARRVYGREPTARPGQAPGFALLAGRLLAPARAGGDDAADQDEGHHRGRADLGPV